MSAKKSPFAQLYRAIERELFDLSLKTQSNLSHGAEINHGFVLGYRAALLSLLQEAKRITRQPIGRELLSYDGTEESFSRIIERLEKGS